MPEVCRIGKGSIKVCIHTNEHGEPHVHVQYDSEWTKVAISDGHIIKGKLPSRQRRLVAEINRDSAPRSPSRLEPCRTGQTGRQDC